jgi:hypothetical protein
MTATIEALYRTKSIANKETSESNVTAFISIYLSLYPYALRNETVTGDCDVTRVLLSYQRYYIRYKTFIPLSRIATKLDERTFLNT